MSKKQKVLIVTYYWTPSGGAGVQRWVKFVKYLSQLGYEPHVYTPDNPNYPVIDHSFDKDIPSDVQVVKQPIWEPYDLYKKFVGLKKEDSIKHTFNLDKGGKSSNNWKQKLSIWLKCNAFIPDPRVFWRKDSVKFLQQYLAEHQISTLITTGPPQSMHLIGLDLKRKNSSLKWIADFRDPWTTIYYFDSLPYSFFAKAIHKKMERSVLSEADEVITVGKTLAAELGKIAGKKVHVITNGFDSDDFSRTPMVSASTKFELLYVGTLNDYYNIPILWDVLQKLCEQDLNFKTDFKLKLIGNIDAVIVEQIKLHGLEQNMELVGYLPHSEISAHMAATQLLLLTIPIHNNKGILTGKVFEYIASLKNIFAIAAKGSDVAEIIEQAKAGVVLDFNNFDEMLNAMQMLYQRYKNNELKDNDPANTLLFTRKQLTQQLIDIIQS